MGVFDSLDRVRPYRIWDGAVARAVAGERITFAVVDLEPDLEVPEHHHPNEQVGMVLKGFVTMTVDGESRRLGVGETYVIPGNVPHGARTGPEGASVLDVFSPIREDWEQLQRLDPSAGAWPT
ncbi:MAG TPA: cupin domain-containing protein [Candidatus Dormibacteraeota bacterium]|jgi:quercetin dioxygenase-like cupin family protein